MLICTLVAVAPAPARGNCDVVFVDGFEAADIRWWQTGLPSSGLPCSVVPPSSLVTFGATFDPAIGDLDLSAYDAYLQCIGGRLGPDCVWSNRTFETGEELLSSVNVSPSANRAVWWLLEPVSGGVLYEEVKEVVPYLDGPDCEALFTSDSCEGRPGGELSLVQLPLIDPGDPFLGDGYRAQTPANYRWARRELIMTLRWAIRATQERFADTRPLGVGDIAQRDGNTPGFDLGALRHPAGTHGGGDVDVAYYTTLAASGVLEFNEIRGICDANDGSNDGQYCDSTAATTHVVDLPRQAYFLAHLSLSRLRVFGVDEVIAPLLLAEADRQLQLGWITQAQRDLVADHMGYGEFWPFAFRFIHISLLN